MTTEVKTTVPGNIWKVLVQEGDEVKKDDNLFIMEVMKTEVHHSSPVDGKVVQESKIDGNMGHDFNIPIRVITGIDDEDDEPIEVTPQPEDNSIRKVTPEQAKIEDERGWYGTSIEFVDAEHKDK